MTRWWMIAALAALVAAPVLAQGYGVPAADGGTSGAAGLFEDVRILQTVRALSLTSEQLQLLQQLNPQVRAAHQAHSDRSAQVWEQYKTGIEDVVSARQSGARPDARDLRAAGEAARALGQADSDLAQAEAAAAVAFTRALTGVQQALVETQQQALARQARVERMGGFESVGEYVATELDAIRDLMRDEYRMLAPADARRIATGIVTQDSPQFDAVVTALLGMMNQARRWPPDVYEQQRSTLPEQIEAALGIASNPGAVSYNDVLLILRSERTPGIVAMLGQDGRGEAQ